MDIIDPHVEFYKTPIEISSSKQKKCQVVWKNYVVSENGRTSLFSQMERIKLVYSTLEKTLNVNFIIDSNFLTKIFPLNDPFELKGNSKKPLFD